MRELLGKIEAREATVNEEAGCLREQIARLTEQLAAAECTLERLKTTHETLLELAGEDHPSSGEQLPSAYQQILALFEDAGDGLRARDLSRALGNGSEPRHTEGTRAKLKRLVGRGILTEPEPGLFTLPRPAN